MQCYLSGASTTPNKRLQKALVQETESEWQPQVRAQARQRAASSGGLVISCRAYFGLGPEGTSYAGRVRDLTVAVTPSRAAAIIAAQAEGATENDLHDAVAEAIADAYFRRGGGGRAGLEVQFVVRMKMVGDAGAGPLQLLAPLRPGGRCRASQHRIRPSRTRVSAAHPPTGRRW
ncbi:telomere-protecting terminal protein Tpg [Streptomyces huasconensis]|uniref:telomere-protecting terminal protein Tpg n=1 Tax=Streptomyces huasconensis TaxID=1854574 RepID=UPI003710192B